MTMQPGFRGADLQRDTPAGGGPAFNGDEALAMMDGDRELLNEVVSAFLAECPAQLAAVQEAVRGRNPLALVRTAHHLKGSLSAFGRCPAMETAAEVETMARNGRISEAPAVMPRLEEAIARLAEALIRYTEDEQPR